MEDEVKTYTVIRSSYETVTLTGTFEEVSKMVEEDQMNPTLSWDESSDYTYNFDIADEYEVSDLYPYPPKV